MEETVVARQRQHQLAAFHSCSKVEWTDKKDLTDLDGKALWAVYILV